MIAQRVTIAWELIGHEGRYRVAGGRAEYESVSYSDATNGDNVRLHRMETTDDGRLKIVTRYVNGDTPMVVLEDDNGGYLE